MNNKRFFELIPLTEKIVLKPGMVIKISNGFTIAGSYYLQVFNSSQYEFDLHFVSFNPIERVVVEDNGFAIRFSQVLFKEGIRSGVIVEVYESIIP